MSDHVTEWLGVYHDSELHGVRLRQVEQHLAECVACQAELDEIRDLSVLLRDTTSDANFLPTERFVANLSLSLPRRSGEHEPHTALKIGWWLIPAGLLGIWLFIDITRSLSILAMLTADSGLLNGNLSWLQGGPLQMSWFATAMDLFGNQLGVMGREILSVLNSANLLIAQLARGLIPEAILAVSYLGWLMSWWLRHQHQTSQSMGGIPRS